MATLAGVIHIANFALALSGPSLSETRVYGVDKLQGFAIPKVRRFELAPNGQIVQTVRNVRLRFLLSATVWDEWTSPLPGGTKLDFVEIVRLACDPTVNFTFYPDASKSPDGAISVVPVISDAIKILESVEFGRLRRDGTLTLESNERVAPSTLTFYKRY